ncbi:MAG: tRNA (adenosine(37)-N6)-dimethylallyltransferase MiaA [Sedimentisphaerales bacterium]|nr:tRNA (adenosine(37)-N6)-dimethylallyltransferase MiaA [Sedimentisphaerales bacterium]
MILILGVTASGKGRLAFELAKSLDAEIISIDSMKVYRRMDIGTAKPSIQDRRQVRYHLIDIIEPSDSFSVGAFHEEALQAISRIKKSGKRIIAVGGTALYIKALLYGLFEGPAADPQVREQLKQRQGIEGLMELYRELAAIDPVAAERIDPNDSKRIIRALEVYTITGKPISSFQKQWETHSEQAEPNLIDNWTIIGLRRERTETASRINKRVKKMILAGLVDEVKSLLDEEKPLSRQSRCAIGYAEIIQYLNGRMDLRDATELIKKNTRRLAKSQRTWFKTFRNVNWLDIHTDESDEQILIRARQLLSSIDS